MAKKGHLEGSDVEVVGSYRGVESDCAVGHVMMPLQLAPRVFGLEWKCLFSYLKRTR